MDKKKQKSFFKLDFMVLTFQKKINYYHFDFLISRRVFGPQTKFTMGFPYCNFGDISKKKLFIKIIYQFGDGGPDHAALSQMSLSILVKKSRKATFRIVGRFKT